MKRIESTLKTNGGVESVAALLAQATPAAVDLLQELAATTTDKDTRKAARRALYLLSQRGIMPHAVQPAQTVSSQNDVKAYASVFDGAGNRVLFLTWPDPDGGSPTFSQILLSDEMGVKGIATARLSRREFAARLVEFSEKQETGVAVAEIELDYGRFLLQQARSINQQRWQKTPMGFLDVLSVIGEPEQNYPCPPVWNVFSPEEIQNDAELPHDPAALFRLIWFEAWFMDVEDVNPWLQSVLDIASRLNVSDTPPGTAITDVVQRLEVDAIAKKAATALLRDETRARYVGRLEESADILRRSEQESAARQALFHALNLRDATTAAESPFAVLLVQRTLQAAVEMARA